MRHFSPPSARGLCRLVVLSAIVGGSTARAQIPATDPVAVTDGVDRFEECIKSSECVAHLPPEFAERVRQQQAADFNRKRALDLANAATPAKPAASTAAAPNARAHRTQDSTH